MIKKLITTPSLVVFETKLMSLSSTQNIHLQTDFQRKLMTLSWCLSKISLENIGHCPVIREVRDRCIYNFTIQYQLLSLIYYYDLAGSSNIRTIKDSENQL